MPKPATSRFADYEDLVSRLQRRPWQDDFRKMHDNVVGTSGIDMGPLSAIHRSVSGSTFRAFRSRKEWTPSLVFREWAGRRLVGGKFNELVEVDSRPGYRGWAIDLARNLDREWQGRLREPLGIPRALKLINLLAKGLCAVSPLWPAKFKTVVWFVHVPLDKYSLRPLACIPELSRLGINWNTATMSSVLDIKTYDRIQKSIHSICEKATVPALAYDFLAWDVPHRNV